MCVGPDYGIVTLWNMDGCAIVQAASHWFLTAGGWVQFQGIQYRICDGQSGTKAFFFSHSEHWFSPAVYHSANAVYYLSAFLPWYSRPSLVLM